MNKLFVIQLITSFIVGGGFIALLSFIAERVSARVAGIIIVFPSTSALGFFFLGWTLSPEAVVKVIPTTLIPLGLAVLFPALYVYIAEFCAKFLKKKVWQIIVSFTISISIWFLLSLPVVILQFSNLAVGVMGYVLLAVLAHSLLHHKNYTKPISLTYTLSQKIGRAAFAGFIIVLVVFLGKMLNPLWGGMFSMFPAALSSSLMILHWYYDPKSLFPAIQRAPIGSIAVLVYMFTAMLIFPTVGFILGTIISYAVSIVTALLISKFQIN